MPTILGIDAAWTAKQPSGVALIQEDQEEWRVICVAPSYKAFIDAGRGKAVDWQAGSFVGDEPRIPDLLTAALNLGASSVDLIALDIPLARGPFQSRRPSDSAISRAFGGKGCSTHSPSSDRPGPISDDLVRQLNAAGYILETTDPNTLSNRRAIEVYPHPALLSLLDRNYRVPYKVANSTKYWKGQSLQDRIGRLLDELESIYQAFQKIFGKLQFELPAPAEVMSLSHLKRHEDALDALVCAWVGQQHLQGNTRPYGDIDSAIWVPEAK